MKHWFVALFLLLNASGFVKADCTLALQVNDTITPATFDLLERGMKRAAEKNCESLFLKINTPGGDLHSTRKIVELIFSSEKPFLCLITPSGGHAGSAGAIILQACHINGGLSATNLGAATPILPTGEKISDDLRNKMINDTASFSEGLAKHHGRNLEFARKIVTEAQAVTSEEAVKIKALDFVGSSEAEFLEFAKRKNDRVSVVVEEFSHDLRYEILKMISDPEIAYMLFMASLALLYYEITHVGLIAPGVLGGMGLVLSLVALNKLDVSYGGLGLLILGLLFLILEMFVPSFGLLGIGGIISVVVGSIFLFDTEVTGYAVPASLIAAVVIVVGSVMLGIGYLAAKTIRRKPKQEFFGDRGKVVSVGENKKTGQMEVKGEIWSFIADEEMSVGDFCEIKSRTGLVLTVKKKE